MQGTAVQDRGGQSRGAFPLPVATVTDPTPTRTELPTYRLNTPLPGFQRLAHIGSQTLFGTPPNSRLLPEPMYETPAEVIVELGFPPPTGPYAARVFGTGYRRAFPRGAVWHC